MKEMAMRALVLAAAAAAASILAAADERPVAIGAFSAIEAAAGMSVTVEPGAPRATLVGDPRYFDRVIVEVQGDTLKISRKSWTSWGSSWRDQVKVRVTGPADLKRLAASSGADLTAVKLVGGAVDLDASSGAELKVAGTCTTLRAEASSGADLDARKLICQDASASASSGADLDVYAEKTARGGASSGADVTVHGTANLVEKSSSSGGSVRKSS
jgi:hypothetical protein